jgi:hypothetical protein
MTPERYQQVKAVFHAASELAPALRVSYLEQVCGTDTELRREVEQLLHSADAEHGAVDRPAIEFAPGLAEEAGADSTGKLIGPYRLVR